MAKADATAALEGAAGNRMSIQILKQTVEAKTRKLSARWTFESAQDAQSQHGIDVEAEIMAALAQEITAEIDQEILGSLATLAGTGTDTFEPGWQYQVQLLLLATNMQHLQFLLTEQQTELHREHVEAQVTGLLYLQQS